MCIKVRSNTDRFVGVIVKEYWQIKNKESIDGSQKIDKGIPYRGKKKRA